MLLFLLEKLLIKKIKYSWCSVDASALNTDKKTAMLLPVSITYIVGLVFLLDIKLEQMTN